MIAEPLLRARNLRTVLAAGVRAVDGVDLEIGRGETFALVGESGCGKTMTALSLLRLLPERARVEGTVEFEGIDLLELPEPGIRNLRGRKIAMIFQEPATSLNPVLGIGTQIREVLERHTSLRDDRLEQRILDLLDSVGIPDAARRVREYPFQLSGGLKQRAMIAMALAGEPDLLIADEPTTAVDVAIQSQLLELLSDLQKKTGMAILLITHDLGVVARMAHRVAVMYAGQIVEVAAREQFFAAPQHPYSRKLFEAVPGNRRDADLAAIPGQVPPLTAEFGSCRFAGRCDFAFERCRAEAPGWTRIGEGHEVRCFLREKERAGAIAVRAAGKPGPSREAAPLLSVRDLKVYFPIRRRLLRGAAGEVKAVDGVSLSLAAGRTLGLVGESGCGKTTVGRAILQLVRPTAGEVILDGVDLVRLGGSELRARRRDVQIIFQDPYASLNPRMRVGEILSEGMTALGVEKDAAARARRVAEILDQVGLARDSVNRFPHEFSGGQRQRIAIARALAVRPKLIVCDEPTSALDVSVQAQILNLLRSLQKELSLSYLFITHNLAVVEYLAHEVAVMYLGRIVERGTVEEVLGSPKHPYTQALLAAVPRIEMGERRLAIRLEGELPSPVNPPSGCHFHPRCPRAMAECRENYPEDFALSGTRSIACWLYRA